MLPSANATRWAVRLSPALLCAGLLLLLGLASFLLMPHLQPSSLHPTLRATLGTGRYVSLSSLAFSPDGRLLASSADCNIKLWDVATGLELATLSGPQATVRAIAFSPNGKMLASGAMGEGDGMAIILWDVATRQPSAETMSDRQM
jgi:WD40 repeat protein